MHSTTLWAFFAATATAIVVPPPAGPYSVKTQVHDLTDDSRWDPYASANATHKRRILASSFLPLESCDEGDEVETPYLPPATEAAYIEFMASFGVPPELLTGYEVSYCRDGAGPSDELLPLIVISPGFTGTRLAYNVQARALASLGYAVVTIDHPYEGLIVEFPDGTVTRGPVMGETPDELLQAVDVRAADISFLLDELSTLDLSIDTTNVVAIGHSMGGWASAAAAYTDDRIAGGMNYDGMMAGPVVEAGLTKPFILTGIPQTIAKGGQEGWRDFYDHSRGPRMIIGINETVHNSFTDLPYMLSLQDIPAEALPILHAVLGSIDGEVIASIQTRLAVGLADLVLTGDASTLREVEEDIEQVTIVEDRGSC